MSGTACRARFYIAAAQQADTVMRITFLNGLYPPYGNAGAENSLRLLAANLQARGHTCSVLALSPAPVASAGKVDGVPVDYLPLTHVYWPYGDDRPKLLRPAFQMLEAFNPCMLPPLLRVLAERRPDVLHCHNLQGFSAAAWVAGARRRVPVVQTLHDYYVGCPRSAMWRPGRGNCTHACRACRIVSFPRRRLSAIPSAVTAVSHCLFNQLVSAGAFPAALAGRQAVRIIRGNNDPGLPPPAIRAADPARLRLGFMGRLDPTKGLETLLDAVTALPTEELTLAIAGRGRADYLATLRQRAGTAGNIAFLGHVRPADFFPEIDLLVIPSVWEDPFPRVYHEALAYGVPTLASPRGGLREVIRPGETGFVAATADAAGLHAALDTLRMHGWDRDAMRLRCRASAVAYSAEHIANQYEAVLRAAASRKAIPDDAGEIWRASPAPKTGAPVPAR